MERPLGLALQPDPERLTWGRFLDDVAARHGERVALRAEIEPGGAWRETSFVELRREARALARGLIGAGVVKGARVAIWLGNGPDWAVASFAVALVGGVLVPVNTFAKPSERDYILRHSDASILLLQSALAGQAFADGLLADHPALASSNPGRIRCAALPQLRRVVCLDAPAARGALETRGELLAAGADVSESLLDQLAAEVTPADDGILIYTSGTTAHPKGVLHLQRAPVIQSWRFAELMGLRADDRVLTAQPFFWTAGIAMSLGASLAAGASLMAPPLFSPEHFLTLVESESVTTLHAWPHQDKAMAEHPDAKTRDLTSLTKIERSSPLAALAGLTVDDWGTYGSYGLSETFTLASALPASAPAALRKDTSGLPLAGMQIRVVDPESGEPLGETGAKGEIAVKGATFMRGYYKVAPERYLDDDGYFHTQDGGWLDADGLLHWTGRLSNLIKTGGANVSPLEIEGALAGYAGIHLAQAVGVPHPSLGEAIVLCVVPAPGAELAEDALRAWLRPRMAAYKLPRRVLFFTGDELRFTANQKLQVGALRELASKRLAELQLEIDGVRYGV